MVLRPAGDVDEANWRAGVLERLVHTEQFRTPRPIRAASGRWVEDGWEAWQWLPGAADESRLLDVVRAGTAFHHAISALARPAFIDTADDPWSRADRIAWEEAPLPSDAMLGRLAAAFRPVDSPSQLIHGDLLGNVLFAEGEPPAIIDWAPYWRPTGLGSAIAAVDAVCWHGAPIELLSAIGRNIEEWDQLLLRALTFRMVTLHLCNAWDASLVDRHAPVVDAVLLLVQQS
ncbi:TIGR02569 family protein [Glycomyces arizonensis]|uniref:TIGR02569 family protein n=1 Tax=Glycomyces arizonensis TaxID=256035 RepID=UPI001B7FDE4D|nr:TIGR02569 family protein [Glycomyces arizonensis]